MSSFKAFYMRCDHCGFTTEELTSVSAAHARRIVLEDGWTHPRANARSQMRIDVCVTCSEEAAECERQRSA